MEGEISSILVSIKDKYRNIINAHHTVKQHPCRLKNINVGALELLELVLETESDIPGGDSNGKQVCISYSSLFDPPHNETKLKSAAARKIILIQGEAAVGKTVLCMSVVEDWASGKLFQEFQFVVLLPLGSSNVASASSLSGLLNVLYTDFKADTCSKVANYLKKKGNRQHNVLIIVDEWEELQISQCQTGSFLHSLLFSSDIIPTSSVTVLITSRPGCVQMNILQSVDRLITLTGFDRKAIEALVQSEFASDFKRVRYLTTQLNDNPLVANMCRIPLNFVLVCHQCQSNDAEPLPNTMTDFYSKLIWTLTSASIKSNDPHGSNLSSHHDLPEELQQSWWQICELAFRNIEKGHNTYSPSDATVFTSPELKKISYFGLIKPMIENGSDSLSFSFLHPYFEEYFAALHLAKQPQEAQLKFMRELVADAECKTTINFWHFFITNYTRVVLNVNPDIIIQVLKVLSTANKQKYFLDLCHLSYEAKNNVVNEKVVEAISLVDTRVLRFGRSRNAYDSTSMVYVLQNVTQNCKVEINFQNCNLKPEHINHLANVLHEKSNTVLVRGLNLSGNKLSNSLAVDFFNKAAATLKILKILILCKCDIGTTLDIKAILFALTESASQTLTHFDLSFNPISISFLQILQKHIESYATFESLQNLALKGSLKHNVTTSFLVKFSDTLSSKCKRLRRLDLSDNSLGEPGNPDLSKVISQLLSLGRDFNLCLNEEYMSEVHNEFICVMEESIKRKGTINHTIAHGVIVGPGRSGKNMLMSRLMGNEPPEPDTISPSTGVLENVVKIEVKKLCTVASAVSNLKWKRLQYDEEALELIMTTSRHHSVETTVSEPIATNYIIKHIESPLSGIMSSKHPVSSKRGTISKISNLVKKFMKYKRGKFAQVKDIEKEEKVVVYTSDIKPVDIFKKAVKLRGMDALREHLESSWSLYLTNTGGQIEFQEYLPLLVCGPSIFIVTFPLHCDLEKPYDVCYEYPDGRVETYKSPATLLQELLQTLATISATNFTGGQQWDFEAGIKPKIFFVGTHKDCLPADSAEEIIKRKDQLLQNHVRQTILFDQGSIKYSQPPVQLIFAVNNLSYDDDEFQKIRSVIQITVEKGDFMIKCPSSWLILSLILRAKHKSDRVLTFDKCFSIARECGITDRKELKEALSFIHSRLGLVRYFNVEDLNTLVVVDPQVLFDKITDLIVRTFTTENVNMQEIEDFHQRGIIPVPVMQIISNSSSYDSQLPFVWLAKLLNYLRIAAFFTDSDGDKCFFPSALCHAPGSHSNLPTHSDSRPSLCVGFKSGFCPRGIPGALINYLMTNKMSKRSWNIIPNKMFRNEVTFAIQTRGNITLRILPTHLEISYDSDSTGAVSEDSKEEELMKKTCEMACLQIKKGMSTVTSQCVECHYYFGFYCTLGTCQAHKHPAQLEWDGKNPFKVVCKVANRRGNLPKGYEIWNLLQVHISADSLYPLVGHKITVTAAVMGQLNAVSYQWLRNESDVALQAGSTAKNPSYEGLGTSKLTITQFTHDYEGKYQCSVTFEDGEVVKSDYVELTLGTILTESDCRILMITLAEHLEESGLNLYQHDHPHTKEEVAICLKKLGQHEYAKILRKNRGVQRLQAYVFNNIYKNALLDKKRTVRLQVFRMVLCGIPRAGKTTFWKRLAIKGFKPCEESPSTGSAESHLISAVKKEKQESEHRAHVHTEMLFDFHLNSGEKDADHEALTIYKLIINAPEPQAEAQAETHTKPHDKTHESQPLDAETHKPHDKSQQFEVETHEPHNISQQFQVETHKAHDKAQQLEVKTHDEAQQFEAEPHASERHKPANSSNQSLISTSSDIGQNSLSANNQKDHSAETETHTKSSVTNHDQQPNSVESTDPIITEIDKLFKKLHDLLRNGEYSSVVPNIKKMCHLQDVGGQRAFLELLPTLSVGKALYLLFFNYKDFETRTDETVQMKGSSIEVRTGTEFEQIDVIMKSLICMSTTSTKSSGNVALLVGTHVDKVKPKNVSDVNGIIYERVKPFLGKTLVYAESGDDKLLKEKLVLKVAIKKNSICKHEPEHYGKVVMNIVENELKCPESDKLPASWYMFTTILHRIRSAGYSVLRYNHCQHIADKLNINQSALEGLLFRLQKVFGIILYFPEVEGLEDIVICDPPFVYESISELIFGSFCDRCDVQLSQKLKKQGMFKLKDLKERCKTKNQAFGLDKLIILLKYLGIIAPVQCSTQTTKSEFEGEVRYPDNEDIPPDQEYVIPCVLKDAKGQELEVQIQDTQACSIVPLRIYFDCGFAPMGGFCYLFTKLISNNKATWRLHLPDELEDDNNIYWRNKVTFDVEFESCNYVVTLLSTDEYYEIYIIHFVSEQPFRLEKDGRSICMHVWEAVHTILENSPNESLQTYKTACICTSNHYPEIDEHMMKFTHNPHEISTASQVEAWCVKKSTTKVKIMEVQPSVIVWFKEPYIVKKEKFGTKVDLCIRDLWFKIEHSRETPKCQWKFNGHEVKVDNEHYKCKTSRNSFELSILRFESKYIGEYECVISTAEEAIVQSAIVSMAVKVDADSCLQIIKHPENNSSIKHGKSVTLSVSAVGAEHYKWKWKATNCVQVTEISMKAGCDNTHLLSIGDLKKVLDRTWPYRANWELIGIELGIDQGSLEAIKKNCMNSGGVEECLKDMITKWLRSNSPKPTWLALNRALESVSGQSGEKKYNTESDAKYIGADGPILTINGFSTCDQGEYLCVIKNSYETIESNSAKMELELQILEHPKGNSRIKYHNGEPAHVTLSVSAVGSGCLTYQWKKDGKAISDSKQCSGTCEPTLKINGFSTDDQGEYSCVIKNNHKTIESNSAKMALELQILEHPEGNSTVKYHNGEPACVTLNVSAVGSGCLSYRWKKNGKPIRDSIKCSGICEPTLIINGFSTDDQGEYSCIIKNSRKTIESNSVKMELELQILEHPKGNSRIKYHNGEPARVTLSVSAVGSGCLSYQWKKDGKAISDSKQCSGTSEPTLTINGFSTDSQGEYSCVIKNNHKTIESNSAKMEQDVQILNHPQENLIINCCERVTLSVSAVGPGQLSYQWKKDGLDVRDPNCSGIKESKLIIPSFRHKDQGHYKCEIKDDHNKAIESNTAELKLRKACQILGEPLVVVLAVIMLILPVAVAVILKFL